MHKNPIIFNINERVYGGTHDTKNLIPLCSQCHTEWDHYDAYCLDFEEFLLTPSVENIAILLTSGYGKTNCTLSECFRMVNKLKFENNARKCEKKNLMSQNEYFQELYKQNKIFSQYKYSDMEYLFIEHGYFLELASEEDIVSFAEEQINKRSNSKL